MAPDPLNVPMGRIVRVGRSTWVEVACAAVVRQAIRFVWSWWLVLTVAGVVSFVAPARTSGHVALALHQSGQRRTGQSRLDWSPASHCCSRPLTLGCSCRTSRAIHRTLPGGKASVILATARHFSKLALGTVSSPASPAGRIDTRTRSGVRRQPRGNGTDRSQAIGGSTKSSGRRRRREMNTRSSARTGTTSTPIRPKQYPLQMVTPSSATAGSLGPGDVMSDANVNGDGGHTAVVTATSPAPFTGDDHDIE
jgi:hypothetical protein